MNRLSFLVLLSCILLSRLSSCFGENTANTYKWPTVVISILVRNKAHTLPYFFSCLQKLDYPKDRIYIWIHSDYNEDKSIEIIEKWSNKHGSEYNGVHMNKLDNTTGPNHRDEESATHWSTKRFKHVIGLREKSLNFARKKWADYLFMLDADVFFTNPSTLKLLLANEDPVVAPMLNSDGLYSNFWLANTLSDLHAYSYVSRETVNVDLTEIYVDITEMQWRYNAVNIDLMEIYVDITEMQRRCGMTPDYYYKRTDDYKPILNRKTTGCFVVPMVHTAVLISLRHVESDSLTYDPKNIEGYDGPVDDIIAFAYSAKKNGINMKICNEDFYGFVPVPLGENEDLENDYEQILNVKLEAISRNSPIPLDPYLEEYVPYPNRWKFGCDEIYMINLERRKERRQLMELSFKELGIDATLFEAVDGRNLDLNDLSRFSIALMPNYEDPYHERPMKAGEVGCFLSHYYIWKKIVEKHHAITLVLEDDIHFVPYFRAKFLQLMDEIKNLNWDLVYIGRKILQDSQEEYVTEHVTRPLYSYWTLGYLISEQGARKLLDAEPLSKMLPVDEFLPIMFDQHPNNTWKAYFHERNLNAFSAAPLLVNPTHYTGDPGYVSDTEDSSIIDDTASVHLRTEL